ncbi:MAG: exonuclease SbcCD subunit D [Bacteroidales bacterium]|nr:exonuclease SbcCD subunit D [Bacteroidales bacterium]
MKILHTSDWHLGHTLYGYDRTEEQTAMLEQLCRLVGEHRPDAFLLCGDVFHTAQPAAATQTLLANALVKIHEAHPDMVIVATAGNHDSGTKHDIFRTPWHALNVHTIGNLDKENPDSHLIEVPEIGHIVAVPYCHERNLPEGFFQQLLDRVAERNQEGLPVVLMAHTTVRGCDFTGHDHSNEAIVGGIDALDLDALGQGYDYLALGHIHHAQFVHSGKHNVRYSGSPLPVSFDECYPHSVSLVELQRHGDRPVVTPLEIDNPHPLVTLPTQGFASWEEAKELLAHYPDDLPAYLRLNVAADGFLPAEAHAEAVELTRDKACRFCHINLRRQEAKTAGAQALSVQEFQSEAPEEIVKRYFDDSGLDFDSELEAVFKEVLHLVQEDTRN